MNDTEEQSIAASHSLATTTSTRVLFLLLCLQCHWKEGQASIQWHSPSKFLQQEPGNNLKSDRMRRRADHQQRSDDWLQIVRRANNGQDNNGIPNASIDYPGPHPHERYLERKEPDIEDISKFGVRPSYSNNNNNANANANSNSNANANEDNTAASASERDDQPSTSAPINNNRFIYFDDDDFIRDNLPYDGHFFPDQNDNKDEHERNYQPLRFRFMTAPLEARRGESNFVDDQIDEILATALPRAAKTWSQHLSVYPVAGSIPLDKNICYGSLASQPLLLPTSMDNADMVILVSAFDALETLDGDSVQICGPHDLALGAACALDQWDRPIVGFINICLKKNETMDDTAMSLEQSVSRAFQEDQRRSANNRGGHQANNNTQNYDATRQVDFETILTHELAHTLGFDSYLFKFFRNGTTGEPLTPRPFKTSTVKCPNDGEEASEEVGFPSQNVLQQGRAAHGDLYYEIVTPRVAQVVRNHFNCPSLKGARLENYERSCVGSHWDERLFLTELLSPTLASWGDNLLSPLTLALMEDTGWYKVDYKNVSTPSFGLGAGCDFVEGNCIVNDKVPSYGKDYFCDNPIRLQYGVLRMQQESMNKITCDPTHQYWAMCDLWDTRFIPSFVNGSFAQSTPSYFSDSSLSVSFPQADFCPVAVQYLGVDCTKKPDRVDGHAISSQQQSTYPGEQMGSTSRCINAFSDISHRLKSTY